MLGRPAPLPLSFPSVRERCERHPRVRSYTLRLPVNDHAGETVPCLSAWLRHALFAPSAPLFVVTGTVAPLLAGSSCIAARANRAFCTGSARALFAPSAPLFSSSPAPSLRSSPAPPASRRAQTGFVCVRARQRRSAPRRLLLHRSARKQSLLHGLRPRAVCALSATLLVVTGPVAALLAGSSCIAARANRVLGASSRRPRRAGDR